MNDDQTVPVAAPIDTDSAGRGGEQAVQSVLRIISREQGSSGTGFLHNSGNLITAEHVIRDTKSPIVILANGIGMECSVLASDPETDLAIIMPSSEVSGDCLQISDQASFNVGTQVSTWGFPGGYNGALPMLSVGYLSAMTGQKNLQVK